ncbi:MAG: ISKra4 family transposase [Gammaproteobacteria bacterium]|nr:ISKra4 family transposase [Gammaproteobacteria bacterium]
MATARYRGNRTRKLTTVVGPIEYQRACCHCKACRQGFFPKDQAMGLDASAGSPGVVRMIGQSAARESFAQSRVWLHELAGVRVSTKQVERTAQRLGKQISDLERGDVALESPPAQTLYRGVDGTGVPMTRQETEGVRGKQADGTSRTREMKVVAVWQCDRFDENDHARTDRTSVTYTAAIETANSPALATELAPFVKRVEREALRRGFYDADTQVVLGDGALWIWQCFAELFPQAVQILDIYHAKQKVWDLSKVIYGQGTDTGRQWAETTIEILRAGQIEQLMAILKPFASMHAEAETATGYFARNRKRMRYAEFRAKGLSVSSAVVEAGCKNVVGTRLKRGGMHWSKAGANNIAALRSTIISNRFDDFWYDRVGNS